MLKNTPSLLTPDLLWALAAMGHGDTIAIVDRNYPAHSLHTRVITLAGASLTDAVTAIATVFPIDEAVEPPVIGMVPDDDPTKRIASHTDVSGILTSAEGRAIDVAPVSRTPFYADAQKAFAVVLTGEASSFACFLLSKGVVLPESSPRD